MPAKVFWEALHDHPSVAVALLQQLTGLLRLYSERVFEFSTLAVNNRIHAELLRLARDHSNGSNQASIVPAPTHAEIASRVSTSREAVTRELNNLARSGLVEQHGRELKVLDLAQLSHMVEEVLGE
jgi:CRP-like cAMP-binding protein